MADVIKIVNSGLAIITNRLKSGGTEPNYAHFGTGTTAPVATNTALETPRSEARIQGASTQQTTTVTNDSYQLVTTLICAGTAAQITEYGQFDALTVGNMFLRGTFDVINLNVGDSIVFTSKVIFAQV